MLHVFRPAYRSSWRRYVPLLLLLVCCQAAFAHEVRPAIADLTIAEDGGFRLSIRVNLEAIIADIGPAHADTAESANAARYEALRALPPEQLAAAFGAMRGRFLGGVQLVAAGQAPLDMTLAQLDIPPVGDTDLARDSVVVLTGQLPDGAESVSWRWAEAFGASILKVQGPGGADVYRAYLQPGQASEAIPVSGVVVPSAAAVFVDYLVIGFEHIVPKGLDHILFVVGLFLFSVHWRPLLWQVTSFTLAHSVTLALGVLGYVSVSPAIVEPLIALSIVYVAVENMLSERLHAWRPMIIFGFGLLHGLGFAGVLEEVGLGAAHFVAGLAAFNIGIELGQLAVIACCFLLVGAWFRNRPWYRHRVVIPASGAVALTGAYWFVERTLL